jgi:hypothetical protein
MRDANQWYRNHYMKRKVAGLCVKCGKPASDATVFCEAHRVKHNIQTRASEKRAAQQARSRTKTIQLREEEQEEKRTCNHQY